MSVCMYVPCVWNLEKWDPMMACSSNSLYEYVNVFLNGYILAKHYFYYILIVFQGWSSSSCAKSVTSTINAPKFWTSEMWGLGRRSSLSPGMWLCATRLRPQVSCHDTCLVGLYGVMEWFLSSKRKAKKESMVKILQSSMILKRIPKTAQLTDACAFSTVWPCIIPILHISNVHQRGQVVSCHEAI